jgi:spore coat protein U-like protein
MSVRRLAGKQLSFGMLRRIALYLIFFGTALSAPIGMDIVKAASAISCAIAVPNINFGNVDVVPGAAFNVTGSINLNCSGFKSNALNRFCISIGSGADFTGSQRQLNGPGPAVLNYDLYKDAARTQLWGSWQTGFDTAGLQIDLTSNGSGNIFTSVPLYAKLFGSQQAAPTGSYSTAFPSSVSGVYVRYGDQKGSPSCDTGPQNSRTGFAVLANVVAACSISAMNISFGSVGFLTSNVDSTSTVTAQCNTSVPYTVSLSGGNAGATDPTQRKMAKAAETVTYGLYRDSARLQPWGSTIGTNTVAGTGTGAAQNITVYGRVPAQTTGSPGNYSDTIVATVTY